MLLSLIFSFLLASVWADGGSYGPSSPSVSLTRSSAQLAPQCPLFPISHSLEAPEGRHKILFRPAIELPSTWMINFVDLHWRARISGGEQLGNERMVPSRAGLNLFESSGSSLLQQLRMGPGDTLEYWFTYCVNVDGQRIDCDTEHFHHTMSAAMPTPMAAASAPPTAPLMVPSPSVPSAQQPYGQQSQPQPPQQPYGQQPQVPQPLQPQPQQPQQPQPLQPPRAPQQPYGQQQPQQPQPQQPQPPQPRQVPQPPQPQQPYQQAQAQPYGQQLPSAPAQPQAPLQVPQPQPLVAPQQPQSRLQCPLFPITHHAEGGKIRFAPATELPASWTIVFVDVHWRVQRGSTAGQQLEWVNERMNKIGKQQFESSDLGSKLQIGAGDTLEYWFTYCVNADGQQVDCDTEHFFLRSTPQIAPAPLVSAPVPPAAPLSSYGQPAQPLAAPQMPVRSY